LLLLLLFFFFNVDEFFTIIYDWSIFYGYLIKSYIIAKTIWKSEV
jgi:hypothetical protein